MLRIATLVALISLAISSMLLTPAVAQTDFSTQEKKDHRPAAAPPPRAAPAAPPQRAAPAAPVQRAAPTVRQVAPVQRAAPTVRHAAPERRAAPTVRRAEPERRAAPTVRRAEPEKRAAPTVRRAAPEKRAVPTVRRAEPEKRAVPTVRRAAPEKRAGPTVRQATPEQQQIRQQQLEKRAAERQQRQQQLQQRQQAQKLQRERAERRKAQTQQHSLQRQAISRQRLQQREQHAQQLKIDRQQRAQQHQRLLSEGRQQLLDRRAQRHDRPQITRDEALSSRFAAHHRRHDEGWEARRRAGWSPHHAWRLGFAAVFVPWAGPVFWPYVYDDIFDYTFWPSAYDEGYWYYAYDDLIDSAFYPVGGSYAEEIYPEPTVGARPSERAPAAAPRAEQACGETGRGVTAWPIDKIKRAVQPTPEQQDLLDALSDAAQDAAQALKDACPKTAAATPSERIQATVDRLDATLEAVKIVRPALANFYNSLSEEQRSRFNAALAPKVGAAQQPQEAHCGDARLGLATFPIQQIQEALKPTEDQQFLLDDLEDAASKAASILQSACPDVIPTTPVQRLEAMEKRLDAMLQAAKVVLPAVEDFYASLSDDQKARYSRLGRQAAR